jgi:hypothetical protein
LIVLKEFEALEVASEPQPFKPVQAEGFWKATQAPEGKYRA